MSLFPNPDLPFKNKKLFCVVQHCKAWLLMKNALACILKVLKQVIEFVFAFILYKASSWPCHPSWFMLRTNGHIMLMLGKVIHLSPLFPTLLLQWSSQSLHYYKLYAIIQWCRVLQSDHYQQNEAQVSVWHLQPLGIHWYLSFRQNISPDACTVNRSPAWLSTLFFRVRHTT